MSNSKFQQFLIGMAEFANGTRFRIDQVKACGSCKITDLNNGNHSYAGSPAKAWSSVRYQASVRPDTHNTHGWPKNKGVY